MHLISIRGGEPVTADQYFDSGRVTEFKYGLSLGSAFRGNNQLMYLSNFGEGWGFMDRAYALVFVDNHDNQRGHGGGGDQILTFRNPRWYKVNEFVPELLGYFSLLFRSTSIPG